MRLLVFMIPLFATSVLACCRFDPDTLELETAGNPSVVDVLTGRIERPLPEYWNARLSDPRSTVLQRAEALTALGRYTEAWRELDAAFAGGVATGEQAAVARHYVTLGWDAWWAGGQGELTPARALELAAEHAVHLPPSEAMTRIARWAKGPERADPTAMLHDMFDLRLAPDKTIGSANEQLQVMGLEGAEAALIGLIMISPKWENFDTLYAFSLVCCVRGNQHLAYLARLRAWELFPATGSKVPGLDAIEDFRLLTVPRQVFAGALKEVLTVSGEQKLVIEGEFKARREFAGRWHSARIAYASERLDAGTSVLAADFWSAFKPPVYVAPAKPAPPPLPRPDLETQPAPAKAAMPTPAPTPNTETAALPVWIYAAGGSALAVLVLFLVLRRRRTPLPGARADAAG